MSLRDSVQSLIVSYPNKGVTPETLASYQQRLSDLPEPLVCAAIERLILTSTFLPSIAEIRSLVVEATCGLPTEEAAWQQVRTAMRESGNNPWQVHPLVLEAVREIGTWELKHDEKGFVIKSFRELYASKRKALVSDMMAGALPLPGLESGVQDGTAAIGAGNVTALPDRRSA